MTNGRNSDIAIVGGGLAGGLIAAALARSRPELAITLVESGEQLGGNHRWSWFASDLSPEGTALMEAFPHTKWDEGYDVRFPGLSRHLATPYRSLSSENFDAALRTLLPEGALRIGAQAIAFDESGVILDSGERIAAGAVVDCRGQPRSAKLTGGWQVFYGRHVLTDEPHGLERPLVMDAEVEQLGVVEPGAYRFVYCLPLSPREVFVEDTYYADSPLLDRGELCGRVDAYCAARGWRGETLSDETGVLPVITGGDFAAFEAEQAVPGVARAGTRGGFAHPLTSYSLPQAVETALAIAAAPDPSGPALCAMLEARAARFWRDTAFYRLLGSMLFGAAEPAQRWRVFERFYRLPEELIERFYAARSTRLDQMRVLVGKPPVPVGKAIAALLRGGAPLGAKEEAA